MDGSTACLAVEGATDAEIFATYVREVLGPTLKPGDVVIMDNLPAHKDAASLEIIAQRNPAAKVDMNLAKYLDESTLDELEREGFFQRFGGK